MTVREIDEEMGAQKEREKWIKALDKIRLEIFQGIPASVDTFTDMGTYNAKNEDLFIIAKYTKELM